MEEGWGKCLYHRDKGLPFNRDVAHSQMAVYKGYKATPGPLHV